MSAIQYRDPKESKKLIDSFAFKVLRRLHSLGAKSQTLDDVQQELWCAWCKACELYDPSQGTKFSTFLYTGLQQHINRYVEKNFERFHDQTIAKSLDAPMGDDDSSSLESAVADTSIYSDFEDEDCFKHAIRRLSDRSKQFVLILKEQHPDLIAELRKLEDKRAYAKAQNIRFGVATRITMAMAFDLMDASRFERKCILEEVRSLGDSITQQVA